MSLREYVSLREHACVSSRGAQSTELVSLYIGYWTLNNYYYYYYGLFIDTMVILFHGSLINTVVNQVLDYSFTQWSYYFMVYSYTHWS